MGNASKQTGANREQTMWAALRSPRYLARQVFGVVVTTALLSVLAVGADAATSSPFFGKVYAGDGGNAIDGYLDMPKGITATSDGTIFIADTINNAIRRIGANGMLSTYSGSGEYGQESGRRSKATWSEPEGITVDKAGVLYVADTGSGSIRRIVGNTVSLVPLAGLKRPTAIALNNTTLFIADTGNNRVVSAPKRGGKLTVIARNIKTPQKIVLNGSLLYVVEFETGRILVLDLAKKTKRVLTSGLIEPRALTLVDGTLFVTAGPSGIENELWRIDIQSGAKTLLMRERETEWLNMTSDVVPHQTGGATRLLLLQSGGSSVFSVSLDGKDLTKISGRHRYGDESGKKDAGLLGRPKALAISHDGKKIFVSYAQGNKIAIYDVQTGVMQPLAGHLMDNYREGTGQDARFSNVTFVVSPDDTTLYLTDRNNQRIRSLTVATGESHYLTGAGVTNLLSPTNTTGQIDVDFDNGYQEGGPCPETYDLKVRGCAYFNRPAGLALTKNGKTLYVADTGNNRIRKVDIASGMTSLVAGSGKKGFKDGIAARANFNEPFSIVLSQDEKYLFLTDRYNHAIRQIDLTTRQVTTVAGTGKSGYKEGVFSAARFSIPEYLTLGPDGNLYVADAGSLRIRMLDLKKKRTSLVSGSGQRGKRDGAAPVAEWNAPKGMAFLGKILLVTDFQNDLIRSLKFSRKELLAFKKR